MLNNGFELLRKICEMPKLIWAVLMNVYDESSSDDDELFRMNTKQFCRFAILRGQWNYRQNGKFRPNADESFCSMASRCAPGAEWGVEFCSCVQTALKIGHFLLEKGILLDTQRLYETVWLRCRPRLHRNK